MERKTENETKSKRDRVRQTEKVKQRVRQQETEEDIETQTRHCEKGRMRRMNYKEAEVQRAMWLGGCGVVAH